MYRHLARTTFCFSSNPLQLTLKTCKVDITHPKQSVQALSSVRSQPRPWEQHHTKAEYSDGRSNHPFHGLVHHVIPVVVTAYPLHGIRELSLRATRTLCRRFPDQNRRHARGIRQCHVRGSRTASGTVSLPRGRPNLISLLPSHVVFWWPGD